MQYRVAGKGGGRNNSHVSLKKVRAKNGIEKEGKERTAMRGVGEVNLQFFRGKGLKKVKQLLNKNAESFRSFHSKRKERR